MKPKRAQLALVIAIVSACSVAAAAGSTVTPTVNARLFAKAGPVKMHANLTVTFTQPAAAMPGQTLSNCVVTAPSNPRMGMADRIVCTNAAGQRVVVNAAPSSASLTYHVAARSPLASAQPAVVEIRHNNTVVVTVTPTSGTVAIPLSQTGALLSGQDKLFVQVGGHVYHGKITRIA